MDWREEDGLLPVPFVFLASYVGLYNVTLPSSQVLRFVVPFRLGFERCIFSPIYVGVCIFSVCVSVYVCIKSVRGYIFS